MRAILTFFFGLMLACVIFSVTSVLVLFAEFMPLFLLAFFGIGNLLLSIASALLYFRMRRSDRAAERAQSRFIRMGVTMGLLMPFCAASASVVLMFSAAIPTWNLPRSTNQSLADVSRGDYVTFMVDDETYAFDMKRDALFRWQHTSVNRPDEILSNGSFMHYFRRIVGIDGKEFRIQLPTRHLSAEVFVPPDTGRIYYEVTYAKEENGIWRKSLDGDEEPERYSRYGRDLLWSRDMRWMFLCTARGLERVDANGNPEVIVPAISGYTIDDPVMSPGDDRIAFVMKPNQREGQAKLLVSNLGGEPETIFTGDSYSTVRQPQWSNDGQEIGFLYTPPNDRTKAVRTIAVARADGGGSRILHRFKPGSMLTHPGVVDFCWSPDDRQLVFLGSFGASLLSDEGGGTSHKFDLYRIDRGGGHLRRLTKLNQSMKQAANGFPVIWWHAE